MPYKEALLTEEELADVKVRMDFTEWVARYDAGLILNGARRQAGMTQEKLADLAGVTQAYISKIEGAEANPTIDRLAALLGAMGFRLKLDFIPLFPEKADTKASDGAAYC